MRTRYLLFVGAVSALSLAGPLSAQRAVRSQGARGGSDATLLRGGGIEAALRFRDALELSVDQVAALNALREEHLALRRSTVELQMQLRSDLAAGEISRTEMRAALQEHREARGIEPRPGREQIGEILSEAQIEKLREQDGRFRGARAGGRGVARSNAQSGRRAPRFRSGSRPPRLETRFQRGANTLFRRGFAPRPGFRRPGV